MTEHTLALDMGTTSARAMVMNPDGTVAANRRASVAVRTPRPGYVEQDALAVYESAIVLAEAALSAAGLNQSDVAAIGITTSRANIVVWDVLTGAPIAPLVSWQDQRGTARALQLQSQGLLVTHQMCAAKLEAVLSGIDRGIERINSGALKWGNIDTYLAWRLSDGATYAMDESQACATGYYDYFSGSWNAAVLGAQQIDPATMPQLIATFGPQGQWRGTPIAALIADQQSAALSQGCLSPGVGKVTYGTSATFDVHSGTEMLFAPGAYPVVHFRTGAERRFCVEGMVNTAGAMLDWCASILGVAGASALAALAGQTDSSNGIAILPALQGLGTPHADASATGRIEGLTRATTRADIARATFESIAFRIREIDQALYALPALVRPADLRVDGGASASDFFMQLQADVLGRPIERLKNPEATALGAALAAGIGAGLWNLADIDAKRHVDRVFTPAWSDVEREHAFEAWCQRAPYRK